MQNRIVETLQVFIIAQLFPQNQQRSSGHREQALLITRLNEREKSDRGDTARVMNKYAQALSARGEWKQSAAVKLEAEQIYVELTCSGEYSGSEDEEQKWDYLVCLIFWWFSIE